MAAKIKKGDKVVVLTGKDKGRSGEVTKVLVDESRLVVSGINMMKKHEKPSAASQGGVVAREASIHASNVALADPKDGKPTRVGFKMVDGKKLRVAKRSGETVSA
jgi:large subunit ribosomal protein L24